MTSDRERYDIDWSSLTPAEAAIVDKFAADLRQAREEETAKLWRNVLEIFRKDTDTLIADLRAGCFKNHPLREFQIRAHGDWTWEPRRRASSADGR